LARGETAIPQGRQNLAILYALKGDFANAERVARQDMPRERVAGFLAGFRRFHE
jgi:Flp pilus assembly protein TadD